MVNFSVPWSSVRGSCGERGPRRQLAIAGGSGPPAAAAARARERGLAPWPRENADRAPDFRGIRRIGGRRGNRPAECRLVPDHCENGGSPYENHTRATHSAANTGEKCRCSSPNAHLRASVKQLQPSGFESNPNSVTCG